MKYLLCFITILIVGSILTPIMLFKWDDEGWSDVVDGIVTMFNID